MTDRPISSPPRTPPAQISSEASLLPLPNQTLPFSPSSTTTRSALDDDDDQQYKASPPGSTPEDQALEFSSSHEESSISPPLDRAPQVSAAQWCMPTSGELAFLAGLPTPTVGVYDGAAASILDPNTSTQTPSNTDDDTVTPVPESLASSGEIFSAASRRWLASTNASVFHRRDTWAVGEKWGRHVRVIEVEAVVSGDDTVQTGSS